jgi:hypothetical protein
MQAIRTLRGAAHSHAKTAARDLDESSSQHKSISTATTTTSNAIPNHTNTSTSTPPTTFSRIQTLAKLRRPSPPSTPPASAPVSTLTTPPRPQPTLPTLVHDGSYLQTLGLKLNEAASRALAPVLGNGGNDCIKGRRPIPPGRGKALGALISRYVIRNGMG